MRLPRLRLLPAPPAVVAPAPTRIRSRAIPVHSPRSAPPEFRPTSLQRKFFDLLAAGMMPNEAGAHLSLSRMTFYRWRRDPEFRRCLAAAQLRDLVLDGGALLTVARAKAASHFSYWQAIAQLTFDPAARQTLTDWAEWCGSDAAADPVEAGAELAISAAEAAPEPVPQALLADAKM